MRTKAAIVVLLSLFCAIASFGQERGGGQGRGQQPAQPPAMDKVTQEIPGVVKAGTKIEIVKYGIRGSDAGIGMPDGSVLVSGDGGVLKIAPDGTTTKIVEDSEQGAGLTVDSKGRVIAAQYTKKISVIYPKGSEKTLTGGYDGKPYIRPNDLIADKKGGVYFTDPYQVGATRKPEDLPQAIYYISPDGQKVTQLITDINRPNGITLSADGKTLFANDWDGPYLLTYNVQPDGTLKNRKNFGKYTLKQETDHGLVSGADGLCIAASGHAFATTPAGVQVFSPKGEHLGDIEAPYDMPPQNCGFGGPGYGYLYVTGRGVVYRIKTQVSGIKNQGK